MATAFIFINVDAADPEMREEYGVHEPPVGQEKYIMDALSKVPGVKEVNPLFGRFDYEVRLEAENFQEIGRIVVEDIRQKIKYISNTVTHTASGKEVYIKKE